MGPCIFYLNSENQKKGESFNMPRKLLLFLRNVFFLMARLGVIISALYIPVISKWEFFVANSGLDASTHLDKKVFEFEFSRHFGNGLKFVSDDVGTNSLYFIGFVFFHLYAVASYTVLCSPKFGSSRMTERWLHLLTTFWLPLPYLTLEGVDRGEEKSEQWFLIALHTCENLALLIGSRWAYLPDYPPGLMVLLVSLWLVNMVALVLSLLKKYMSMEGHIVWSYLIFLVALNFVAIALPTPGFERGLFVMDISIITCNTLAVALFAFYTSRVELYAGLPQTFPNLPSFGPEVICQPNTYLKLFQKSINPRTKSLFAGCSDRTSGG